MSLYCLLPIAHLVLKSHNFFWPHDQSFIEQAQGQDGILAFFRFCATPPPQLCFLVYIHWAINILQSVLMPKNNVKSCSLF